AKQCLAEGYTVYGCSSGDCGTTENKDIVNKLDHVYDVKGETVAATCLAEGYTVYGCSSGDCGTTENKDIVNKLDHVYDVKGKTVAPTCIDAGYTVYGCSSGDCGTTQNRDVVEPTYYHIYDIEGETIAPTCSSEGYTEYGCSAGDCGYTVNKNYVARTAHVLEDVNEFDVIKCSVCNVIYKNITTKVDRGEGDLCLGCGKEVCECGVNVEWNAFVAPEAPDALEAGVAFTKNDVEIGTGLIKLESESEANYTVVITTAGGDVTLTVAGALVYVDLYKYDSVTKVVVTADAAASLVLYEIFA
ncbi:MAG: hypothetical protein J6D23_07750, partial [Clostridia bacterium]|nr:hypothetical protein [Clostridia bacterium]